jgi:hypothetical protein
MSRTNTMIEPQCCKVWQPADLGGAPVAGLAHSQMGGCRFGVASRTSH